MSQAYISPSPSLYEKVATLLPLWPSRQADCEACQEMAHKAGKAHKVLAFLYKTQLEPNPQAYQLGWEYIYGANAALCNAIDTLIERRSFLTPANVDDLVGKYLTDWGTDELRELVSGGEKALHNGQRLIQKSRKDSKDYGRSLEEGMDDMTESSKSAQHHLKSFLDLTNAMITKSAETEQQLREAEQKLAQTRNKLADAEQRAGTDQLTGLNNRWAFEASLKAATAKAQESFEPLSLAFVDIDHFKTINDVYGHETGDRLLKKISQQLSQLSQLAEAGCHVSRHGGEEFVVLFPNTSSEQAFELVNKARAELIQRNYTVRETGEKIGVVSFSAGVATLNGQGDARLMLRQADQALYQAKNSGRNQVLVYCDDMHHSGGSRNR